MLGFGLTFWLPAIFGKHGPVIPPVPTGDGSLDFSIAGGDNTALLALLEDI